MAWKMYLRKNAHEAVSSYAAPSRQTDYSNLPPAYTFVGDGEPFYLETCKVNKHEPLSKAAINCAGYVPDQIHILATNYDRFCTSFKISAQHINYS